MQTLNSTSQGQNQKAPHVSLPKSEHTSVRSYTFFSCFVSFLKDNGVEMSREDIIAKCPGVFGAGTEVEGSFSPENFQILERYFPIRVHSIAHTGFSFLVPRQCAFLLVAWQQETTDLRWIRFIGQDESGEIIYLRDEETGKDEPIRGSMFRRWPMIGFMVECTIIRPFTS